MRYCDLISATRSNWSSWTLFFNSEEEVKMTAVTLCGEDFSLASQCLALCQTLVSEGKAFTFSLKIDSKSKVTQGPSQSGCNNPRRWNVNSHGFQYSQTLVTPKIVLYNKALAALKTFGPKKSIKALVSAKTFGPKKIYKMIIKIAPMWI